MTPAARLGPTVRLAAAVSLAAAVTSSSCSADDATDTDVVIDGIAVIDAWVRPTPPGSDEAAIYVSVSNETNADSAILGASSSRCMVVVPHATTIDDGVASMGEALDAELALPAGDQVLMEPNGLHLMCLGLDEPLLPGERFDVSVDFADRRSVDITVDVEQR